MSWLVRYLKSSIGMKQIMGVTGLLMVAFLIAHLLGNLQVFLGRDVFNAYGVKLREFGPLLWLARAGLVVLVVLHIAAAVRLTALNRAARPVRYRMFKPKVTPLYARTMAWSGLIVLAFVVFHLLHFTFGSVFHDYYNLTDAKGRHDIYSMLVLGFREPAVSVSYIIAMALLCFHLAHGIPSLFQSLGFSHPKYDRAIERTGLALAWILFVGFTSIPVAVLLGWVAPPAGV